MYKIGITTGLLRSVIAPITKLDHSYIDAVRGAGALPIMIPVYENLENVPKILDRIDALILSGGVDISPLLYGEDPEPEAENFIEERDRAEMALFLGAMERKMPILAICRGMQLANVALGGTLFQDLEKHGYSRTIHRRREISEDGPDETYHFANVEPGSRLYGYMGAEEIIVNSIHHQAIREPAQGFLITSRSRDGIIESVELEHYPNFWGFQFHPERMLHDPGIRALFRDFIGSIGGGR